MKKLVFLLAWIALAIPALAQGGGAPSVPPITVTEADGSPKVTMPTKIVFPNGSLSITGKTVSVTFSGGVGLTTDTADAQLSVYSQSTTRPSLKLRALSGTLGGQNVLESYNAAGALTSYVTSGGSIYGADGSFFMSATSGYIVAASPGGFAFTSAAPATATPDLYLVRDAANTLALRNGVNAQTLRIYNTYTDASNYERGVLAWNSNRLDIGPQAAGTGTLRSIGLLSNVVFPTDNTYDIGASGANRPRTIYAGGAGFFGGDITSSSGLAILNKIVAGSPSDGVLRLSNYAITDFDRLQFGGTSASFPALKRSGAGLQVRLADDTGYAGLTAATLTAAGSIAAGSGSTITIGNTTLTTSYVENISLGWSLASGVVKAANSTIIGFTSGAANGTLDTALYRNAAGVIEANNGSAGNYRDFIARTYLIDKTITAGGTTGDQTINKSSFTVNFAAAATSLTVTNSLISTSSNVICTVQTNDTTLKSVVAVPGSGSIVLTANAAATAETRVGCVVHN